jgi:hypothetical protein
MRELAVFIASYGYISGIEPDSVWVHGMITYIVDVTPNDTQCCANTKFDFRISCNTLEAKLCSEPGRVSGSK